MASVLAGFRPVKHVTGAPYNGQFNKYTSPAGEAVALNIGDPVKLSDGAAIVSADGGIYPAIERVGTSTTTPVTSGAILGVIVGFEPNYDNLSASSYNAGSTARVVYVADAPDLVFAAPQDAGGGVIAAASVGLNAALVPGTTSTSAPYASGASVDSSSVAVTSTLPLRVMGFTASPDQDVTSTTRPAEVLVMINNHQFSNLSTGV